MLTVEEDSDRIAEYDMKLMDIDAEQLGIPDTDYDARITLPAAEFTRIVKDLSLLGESVRIEVNKEGIRFVSDGEAANGSVLLKPTDGKVKIGDDNEEEEEEEEKEDEEDEDEDSAKAKKKAKKQKKVKKESNDDVEMNGDEENGDEEFTAKSDDEGEDEKEDEEEESEGSSKKRKKASSSKVRYLLCAHLDNRYSYFAYRARSQRRKRKQRKTTMSTPAVSTSR